MSTQGKEIECRAAVTWEAGQESVVEKVTVSVPKAGEIRIKMAATGICYSDITLRNGAFPGMEFPLVLGHEGVGVVESLGPGVKSFKPGDTVIPLWCFACGKCKLCQQARRNFCQESINAMLGTSSEKSTRITCKGKRIGQASGIGLFSEYIVVSEIQAVKVPSPTSLAKIASFGCAMPTGYGSALYTAKVFPGATCAIWGLGAIGLCAALGCKDAGAKQIIGINRSRTKFDIGRKFGCTDCISTLDYTKPISEVVKEKTDGVGVDFAFVCVGSMEAMEDAMEACKWGGGECIILGATTIGAKMGVNHTDLLMGKSLKGSWCGDCVCTTRLPELVEKYIKGSFPTDDLITHELPLDQVNEGFDLLKAGKSIRTVIKF